MVKRPEPKPTEAMIAMRPWASGMAGNNRIYIFRIDPATGEPVRDSGGKPEGAQLTFSLSLFGGKKGERPLRAAIVPAGTYVLGGPRFNGTYTDAFCFGAPRFEVAAGAVTYIGGYQMLSLEKMAGGERRNAMRYSTDIEGARTALAIDYRRSRPGWRRGACGTDRPTPARATSSPPMPFRAHLPLRVRLRHVRGDG